MASYQDPERVQGTPCFKPVSSKVSFPKLEEDVLRFWKERDVFHQVDRARKDSPVFMLYEGPPTANGTPGIHHVLARVFKDIIPRYKTMKGFRPIRKGGWDTHGLPVELEIEKELGLSSKRQIEEYGIERFNARCKESVMRYVMEWEELTERIAFWLDLADPYITFQNGYIESCWWVLRQLWDQGLVERGYKVAPHCPRCVTTLSSHEVALGYQEDTPDPSIFVRFRLSVDQSTGPSVSGAALKRLGYDRVGGRWASDRPAILGWTTTPWTVTANVALAVAPDEEYMLVQAPAGQTPQERLILARKLVEAVLGPGWEEVATVKGEDLVGLSYEPPFRAPETPAQCRVLPADFVSMEEGTGVVHISPAYGAEDQELGKQHGLPTIHTVDAQGVLRTDVKLASGEALPGAGKFFKEADQDLMEDLERRVLLFRRGVYRHTYPFCWRCDTPLLYYAKESWYIRTTARKDRLISGNQEVHWYPEHIQEGRFGEWLRNNVDWALSRERYWGTPLPIWQCAGCGEYHCIGTLAELREQALPGHRSLLDPERLDLHRPYVDQVMVRCQACGGEMRRVPEVMDCWYDSGAMPFAQDHVVSDADIARLRSEGRFPADYICEAVDQTRGWFYSLHALSTLLVGEPCYRNVICLGLILDAGGEKMSKSRGNVVEPWAVINQHGADALRWYLFTAAPPGNARRFSSDLVGEAVRRFLLPLWNVYSFFVTYANLDRFNPATSQASPPRSDLDRWVLSELHRLVGEVDRLLGAYNPTDAGRRIEEFVDALSNWYVRRSRRRFWKGEDDEDKRSAYVTLYTCLATLARLLAPFTPFLAEDLYANLVRSLDPGAPESVHLADFPVADAHMIDQELSEAMALAMRVASLGRAARQKAGIRIRQPLGLLHVITRNQLELYSLTREHTLRQIKDELNVKDVRVVVAGTSAEALVWKWKVTPDMSMLGPRYESRARAVRDAILRLSPQVVASNVMSNQPVQLSVSGQEIKVSPDEVKVERLAPDNTSLVEEGGYVVAVDTRITPELADEGMARELVHHLQNLRRAAGFDIADRIITWYQGDERLHQVMEKHGDYIRQETLSLELRQGEPEPGAHAGEQRIDGGAVKLAVQRASR
ncbi:MAG: isoleucine--tRNA ligase [Chloroflexi bacterium]|nr:isoleucine--tRNA ligase [Chloroflexota bacterium]